MQITEDLIPRIEKALRMELYDWQKEYLLGMGPLVGGRASGKTTAYCIKLALSDGHPLNLNKPYEFDDGFNLNNHIQYAKHWFLPNFMEIRQRLMDCNFLVREVWDRNKKKQTNEPSEIKYTKQILDLIEKDIDALQEQINNTEKSLKYDREQMTHLRHSRIEVLGLLRHYESTLAVESPRDDTAIMENLRLLTKKVEE